MKTCTKCSLSKPHEAFAIRTASKDGLSTWCKLCFASNARDKYASSPEERARKNANRSNVRKRNQAYVLEYLKAHPCVDCGTTDIRVLEFDHRDPSIKVTNVSEMYTLALDRIIEEINKCDVRCANCHRIVTWERAGHWRSK